MRLGKVDQRHLYSCGSRHGPIPPASPVSIIEPPACFLHVPQPRGLHRSLRRNCPSAYSAIITRHSSPRRQTHGAISSWVCRIVLSRRLYRACATMPKSPQAGHDGVVGIRSRPCPCPCLSLNSLLLIWASLSRIFPEPLANHRHEPSPTPVGLPFLRAELPEKHR